MCVWHPRARQNKHISIFTVNVKIAVSLEGYKELSSR